MERNQFFDQMARRWDRINPPHKQGSAIEGGLDRIEIAGKTVVDVGCGTGILSGHILSKLEQGRLIALDFSPEMIVQARSKHFDPRIRWLCREAEVSGLEDGSVDVILCYNTFPHFRSPEKILAEFFRWLKPGGSLLVWHDIGREALNQLHREAGFPVDADLLLAVDGLKALAGGIGFTALVAEEDEVSYTFLAQKGK